MLLHGCTPDPASANGLRQVSGIQLDLHIRMNRRIDSQTVCQLYGDKNDGAKKRDNQ